MIVLSSCYEDSCCYDSSHCASLHQSSFDEMIFTLVPLISFEGVVEIVLFLANPCVYMYTACMYAIIHARALTQSRVVFVQCQNGIVRTQC